MVLVVVIAGDGGRYWCRGSWRGVSGGPSVKLCYVTLQCLLSDERPGAVLADDRLGGPSSPLLDVQLYGVILPGVALEGLQGHSSVLQFVSLRVGDPAVLGVADNFPALLLGVFEEPAHLTGIELGVHRYGDILDDPVLSWGVAVERTGGEDGRGHTRRVGVAGRQDEAVGPDRRGEHQQVVPPAALLRVLRQG